MSNHAAPREHPILFTGPMVRAILDGRKTMTRRIAKPPLPCIDCRDEWGYYYQRPIERGGLIFNDRVRVNPYGVPGDRLWVRETWAALHHGSYEEATPTHADNRYTYDLRYAATDPLADASADIRGHRWRPSIRMFRWASRITLEITDVRCERLQEISEDDARAEGWLRRDAVSPDPAAHRDAARDWFADEWDQINGKRATWASNPWVWVISFERLTEATDGR